MLTKKIKKLNLTILKVKRYTCKKINKKKYIQKKIQCKIKEERRKQEEEGRQEIEGRRRRLHEEGDTCVLYPQAEGGRVGGKEREWE